MIFLSLNTVSVCCLLQFEFCPIKLHPVANSVRSDWDKEEWLLALLVQTEYKRNEARSRAGGVIRTLEGSWCR
jgi:hypothetical protein